VVEWSSGRVKNTGPLGHWATWPLLLSRLTAHSRRPASGLGLRTCALALLCACALVQAQRTVARIPIAGDSLLLKLDACLQPGCYYWHQTDYMGMTPKVTEEHSFSRVTSLAGLTAQLTRHFSARFYGDLGDIKGRPVLDLYARARGRDLSIQLGQFRPPLSSEILTQPWNADFIDYSLIARTSTPTGDFRDIGAQLAYRREAFLAAVAAVNGNGRQIRDDNRFKDVIGRIVATPFGSIGPYLGGHVYLGSDTAARDLLNRPFRRYSGELGWNARSMFVRAELVKGTGTNGFNTALGFRTGNVQPVVRFERVVDEIPNLPISILTFGLNGFFADDAVKPMLDFSWTSDKVREQETFKLTFQLQVAFW
jgi:hypothetical protein